MSEAQISPDEALQVAQRALSKICEVEGTMQDIEADREDLKDELTAVKMRLSEIDDETDYRDMSIDTKIGMVREHAFRKATNGHGKATLTYEDVKWEVFDGKPGNSTCYNLLRQAAGFNSDGDRVQDVPGFGLDESSRPMKLTIDADRAKRGAGFSWRKKSVPGKVP